MKKTGWTTVSLAFLCGAVLAADQKPLPNILLIMTDDQSCDTVACYGLNPHVVSPNVDRLAEEGVLFENAFANAPQCATSRLSVMNGKYCHHIGVYNFDKMHDDTDFYKPPFPTVLYDEKDYWNGIAGKDHIFFRFKDGKVKHGTKVPRFWERALRKSRNAPDRDFYIYSTDEKGKTRIKRNIEPPPEEDEKYGIIRHYTCEHPNQQKIILAGYSDRDRENTMDDFILKDFRTLIDERSAEGDGRPSFFNLSFVFPHTPVLPPEDVAKRFEKINFDVPEFSAEEREHIRTHCPQMWGLIKKLKSYEMKHGEKLKTLQHYYAYCAYGDELVGKAVEDFKAFCKKQDRPWMIIFTADQGWHLHEHGLGGKFTMYDESVRVPLIVASSDKKAFPPGTRYEGLVELVDLAPTIMKAAGIDPYEKVYKENFDGVPLQDLVSGKLPEKDHVICETGHVFGHWALFRTEEWAFSMKTRPQDLVCGEDMDWAKRQPAEELDMMLFNLKNDPDEKRNLAYHPEYQQLRDDFRKKLEGEVLGPDRIEYDWNNHPIPPFQP
jgi:arylsulfatase A-like enzyme